MKTTNEKKLCRANIGSPKARWTPDAAQALS